MKLTKKSKTAIGEAIVARIFDHYSKNTEDGPRPYMGASEIGQRCDRYLWLKFRWATATNEDGEADGRLLRLFERGRRDEEWVIEDLRKAGYKVKNLDENGRQFGWLDGHFGGSTDGIIEGIEGVDGPCILEVKTHNLNSFTKLSEKGVRATKPVHWVQMQIYMHHFGLQHALYVAVNKNDDEMYAEIVEYDKESAEDHLKRAKWIVNCVAPPERHDPEYPPCVYTAKDGTEYFCDFYGLCHAEANPDNEAGASHSKNCRTCISSTPEPDGTWSCRLGQKWVTLDYDKQLTGCNRHLTIPPIINAKVTKVNMDNRVIEYQFDDGSMLVDGGAE